MYAVPDKRASWGKALLGALPFLLFGLAALLKAAIPVTMPLRSTLSFAALIERYAFIAVYWIVAAGLALGGLKRFPRWAFTYLGMALFLGGYYSSGRYNNITYGVLAWAPLLLALSAPVLLTGRFESLSSLLRNVWRDWSCLSFALYANLLPMFTIIFTDGEYGLFELYGLVFDTLLLAAGAVFFLRSQTTLRRVLWLQLVMIVLLLKGLLLFGWMSASGEPFQVPPLPAVLFLLLFWGGLMFMPLLIGLLRRDMQRLTKR